MAYEEARIRELLIDSCHSSKEAEAFFSSRITDAELLALLIEIAHDRDGYLGDAVMQACNWVSRYSRDLLIPYEPVLLTTLAAVENGGGSIALALGKIGSTQGREAITRELGDGSRYDAWLFREALKVADRSGEAEAD